MLELEQDIKQCCLALFYQCFFCFVLYEVNSLPKDVSGLIYPFSVDRGVQTLNVAPSILLFLLVVG